ncbi:hypothetical protein AcW1_010369 [Taiwanofungus camphoratus]|nr:hypothetical protein AcW1_010369 [Antrodia cinnamomea]KAI0949500.1 hypothetical protein AcW1_010369 [Antrodia cinnamomea]
MATALGILGRGVLKDGRALLGVVVDGIPTPMFDIRPPGTAFGVLNGEEVPRIGDERWRDAWVGDENPVDRVGLCVPADLREGLPTLDSRESSCLAVIPTYLEAREPGVIVLCIGAFRIGVTVFTDE